MTNSEKKINFFKTILFKQYPHARWIYEEYQLLKRAGFSAEFIEEEFLSAPGYLLKDEIFSFWFALAVAQIESGPISIRVRGNVEMLGRSVLNNPDTPFIRRYSDANMEEFMKSLCGFFTCLDLVGEEVKEKEVPATALHFSCGDCVAIQLEDDRWSGFLVIDDRKNLQSHSNIVLGLSIDLNRKPVLNDFLVSHISYLNFAQWKCLPTIAKLESKTLSPSLISKYKIEIIAKVNFKYYLTYEMMPTWGEFLMLHRDQIKFGFNDYDKEDVLAIGELLSPPFKARLRHAFILIGTFALLILTICLFWLLGTFLLKLGMKEVSSFVLSISIIIPIFAMIELVINRKSLRLYSLKQVNVKRYGLRKTESNLSLKDFEYSSLWEYCLDESREGDREKVFRPRRDLILAKPNKLNIRYKNTVAIVAKFVVNDNHEYGGYIVVGFDGTPKVIAVRILLRNNKAISFLLDGSDLIEKSKCFPEKIKKISYSSPVLLNNYKIKGVIKPLK